MDVIWSPRRKSSRPSSSGLLEDLEEGEAARRAQKGRRIYRLRDFRRLVAHEMINGGSVSASREVTEDCIFFAYRPISRKFQRSRKEAFQKRAVGSCNCRERPFQLLTAIAYIHRIQDARHLGQGRRLDGGSRYWDEGSWCGFVLKL